jgi:hypothetical protein
MMNVLVRNRKEENRQGDRGHMIRCDWSYTVTSQRTQWDTRSWKKQGRIPSLAPREEEWLPTP